MDDLTADPTALVPAADLTPGEQLDVDDAKREHKRVRRVSLRRRTVAMLGAILILVGGYDVWTTVQNHSQGHVIIGQNKTIIGLGHTIVGLQHQSAKAQDHRHQQNIAEEGDIKAGEKIIAEGETVIMGYHAQTQAQLQQITTLQGQFNQLVSTLAPIIEGIKPADAELGDLGTQLIARLGEFTQALNNFCISTGDCKPVPTTTPTT